MLLSVQLQIFYVDLFLIGVTGALPHGLTFEHPEHSPAWNRCYTGKRKKKQVKSV